MWGVGSAGRKQLEIAWHERPAVLPVLLVECQNQQLAERVGVAVERRADEMADVRPPPGVSGRQLDDIAEHRLVSLHPELADRIAAQLTLLLAGLVQRLLEAGKHHLAEDRGESILDLAAQHRQALLRLGIKLLQ